MLIIETFVFGDEDDQVPVQNFIKDKLFENSRIIKLEYNGTLFLPQDVIFEVSGMKLQFLFDNWGPSVDDTVIVTLCKTF